MKLFKGFQHFLRSLPDRSIVILQVSIQQELTRRIMSTIDLSQPHTPSLTEATQAFFKRALPEVDLSCVPFEKIEQGLRNALDEEKIVTR